MNRRQVAIGVCTLDRNARLERLFDSLSTLESPPAREISVILVDNSQAQSARAIAEARHLHPFPVRYLHVRDRNIALARNAVLDAASGMGCEIVAFTDDDCLVEKHWLSAGVDLLDGGPADIVMGPVHPVFDMPHGLSGALLSHSPLFLPLEQETGTARELGGTGNCFLRLSFIDDHGLRLDTRFGVAGGSDIVFFTDARRAGARLYWCRDAMVSEVYETDRFNFAWVARRYIRNAGCASLMARRRGDRPVGCLAALRRIVRALLRLPKAALHARAAPDRLMILYGEFFRALGLFIYAASGLILHEYAPPAGNRRPRVSFVFRRPG